MKFDVVLFCKLLIILVFGRQQVDYNPFNPDNTESVIFEAYT